MPSRNQQMLMGLIVLVQVADVLLHAASNQLEPLRITANVLLCMGLAALFSARGRALFAQVELFCVGAYLTLNAVFLATAGVVNPLNGNVRLPLFVFVGVSALLSVWLWRLQAKNT